VFLGASLTGAISEVAVYNRALSDAEMLVVEQAMAGRAQIGPPAASFTASPTGLTVAFNASASTAGPVAGSTIASYAWDFGDLTTGTGVTASRTYSAPGTYSVALTVTNSLGLTNTSTQSATAGLENGPGGVATGLLSWLRADTLLVTSGSNVTAWNGIGAAATSAPGVTMPTYSATGLNGRPAVIFTPTQGFRLPNMALGPHTVFVTMRASGTAGVIWEHTANSNNVNGSLLFGTTGSSVSLLRNSIYQAQNLTTNWSTDNVTRVVSTRLTGVLANDRVRFNGTAATLTPTAGFSTATNTPTVITSDLFFGHRNQGPSLGMTGAIAEVAVYNRALSDAEMFAVEQAMIGRAQIGPPTAAFTVTGTGGLLRNFNATASTAPFGIASYSWDFGDMTTGSGVTPSRTYSGTGTYSVALTVTDQLGRAATQSQSVNIAGGPGGVTGASLWLRSDSLVQSTAGVVTQWTDLSGNNMHATNATASMRPTLVGNAMNGRPALRFSGANQGLTVPSGFADFTNGVTIFAVQRATTLVDWGRAVDFGRGQALDNVVLGREGTSPEVHGAIVRNGTATHVFSSGGRFPVNATRLLGTVVSAGTGAVTQTVFVNGKTEAAAGIQAAANVLRTSNHIGTSNWPGLPAYAGDMAEIVIYPFALSTAQRQAVEIEIRTRWGATAAPTITPVWPTPVTAGQAATFSATTTDADNDAVTVTWAFGDGTTATGPSVNKTYAVTGTYTATATATDAFGGTTSSSTTVTVGPPLPGGVAGAALWLRADTAVTLASGKVSSWADLSGNGITFGQASGPLQPTVTTAGMNGRNVLQFTAASLTRLCTTGFESRLNTASFTSFVVTRASGNGDWQGVLISSELTAAGNTRGYGIYVSPLSQWSLFTGTNTPSSTVTVGGSIAVGAATLLTAHNSVSSVSVHVNSGLRETKATDYWANTRSKTCVGAGVVFGQSGAETASQGFSGQVAEVLYFPRVLTSTERANVEADLKARWGTP